MTSSDPLSITRPDTLSPRAMILAFLAAFLASLVLRLWTLGHLSYWLDEALTVRAMQMGWGEMVAERRMNGHFPTYFALLKLLGFDGASEWSVRLPSALLSSLAGGMVAVIGWTLGKWPLAIASGLIFAASPYLVSYGMEARPYSLLVFFAALATAGQLALLSDGSRAGLSLALATVGTVGAVAAIPAGGLVVVAQLAALVVNSAGLSSVRRKIVGLHVAITLAAMAAGAAFLFTSVADQARTPNGLLKWQVSTSIFERLQGLRDAFGFKLVADPYVYHSPLYLVAPVALIVAAVAAVIVHRGERRFRYLSVVSILTPLLLAGMAFFATVASRYLIGMMPAFILLSGTGIVAFASLPGWRAATVPLMAVLALALLLQTRDAISEPTKFDWRGVGSFLERNEVRDVEILSDDPGVGVVMGHYGPAERRLSYRWINAWPGAMQPLWDAASDREIAWILAESDQALPEELVRDKKVCAWPFGSMTLRAIARSPDQLPPRLSDCTKAM